MLSASLAQSETRSNYSYTRAVNRQQHGHVEMAAGKDKQNLMSIKPFQSLSLK